MSRILNSAGQNRFSEKGNPKDLLSCCESRVQSADENRSSWEHSKVSATPSERHPALSQRPFRCPCLEYGARRWPRVGLLSPASCIIFPPLLPSPIPLSSSPPFLLSHFLCACWCACIWALICTDVEVRGQLHVPALVFCLAFSKQACSTSIQDSPVSSHLAAEELGL